MSQVIRSRQIGRLGALVLISAVLLVGCGGGNDDDGSNGGTSVPGSAFDSSGNFIDYLKKLAANDTGEPLTFEGFAAPVDDSSDATPLT